MWGEVKYAQPFITSHSSLRTTHSSLKGSFYSLQDKQPAAYEKEPYKNIIFWTKCGNKKIIKKIASHNTFIDTC